MINPHKANVFIVEKPGQRFLVPRFVKKTFEAVSALLKLTFVHRYFSDKDASQEECQL